MDSSGLPASTNLLSYPGAFSARYHFADINLHHDALHLVQRALRAFFCQAQVLVTPKTNEN